MPEMRELTKQEKKRFDIFIRGYVEGLKAVSPLAKMSYIDSDEVKKRKISTKPDESDLRESYKDKIPFFKRTVVNEAQYRKGYLAGYFRSLSSEQPRAFLDPEINDDIYDYLKNTWLHDEVYGVTETQTK